LVLFSKKTYFAFPCLPPGYRNRNEAKPPEGHIVTAVQSLEHGEHAEHAAHAPGGTRAAILVAVLAAILAICEQRAKHAEIRLEEASIGATDSWAQYQAKSTRAIIARDLADLFDAARPPGTAASESEASVIKRLRDDASHYENGAGGKDEIAKHARALEAERDHLIDETHAYHNAAAALELGIVLSTASAITAAPALLALAGLVGAVGVVLGFLGYLAPAIGAL